MRGKYLAGLNLRTRTTLFLPPQSLITPTDWMATYINRTSPASSFLPVSTTSGLLQPVSSSLDLHNVNPQMQSCRLPQQTSDCALRQPSGHLPSSHNYGIRTTPPTQHPSLPSCTYMQPAQPYPTHLAPNVHMMNMNFTGPMA